MTTKYAIHWWDPSNFICLDKHDFEEYYPDDFQARVEAIKNPSNKDSKKKLKMDLLEDVLSWIKVNEDAAKEKFAVSAKEVINKLKDIESRLLG